MRHQSAVSLELIYRRLYEAFGPQYWWPARSRFEMMVGAILTQATSWHNVEQAIERLRRCQALMPRRLMALRIGRLEQAVRPAGYFRQKARRLKNFGNWLIARYGASTPRMFRTPWKVLRQELLQVEGIGPETADSILLYAGKQPVFVVDAYTRRVFDRHRLAKGYASYDEIQKLAMANLPGEVALYNEFHALLVAVGKRYCHRKKPKCEYCPLGDLPRTLKESVNGGYR